MIIDNISVLFSALLDDNLFIHNIVEFVCSDPWMSIIVKMNHLFLIAQLHKYGLSVIDN